MLSHCILPMGNYNWYHCGQVIEVQRAGIQFLWLEGVSGAEIHWRFLYQYRQSAFRTEVCMSELRSFERREEKKAGQAWCMKREQDALSTSTTDEKIQQAWYIVMVNWWVTIDYVACFLWISHGSAFQIIQNELWLP